MKRKGPPTKWSQAKGGEDGFQENMGLHHQANASSDNFENDQFTSAEETAVLSVTRKTRNTLNKPTRGSSTSKENSNKETKLMQGDNTHAKNAELGHHVPNLNINGEGYPHLPYAQPGQRPFGHKSQGGYYAGYNNHWGWNEGGSQSLSRGNPYQPEQGPYQWQPSAVSPGRLPLPSAYGYTTGPMFEHPTRMYQNQPSADTAYLSPTEPSLSCKTPALHQHKSFQCQPSFQQPLFSQSGEDMDISSSEEAFPSPPPMGSMMRSSKQGTSSSYFQPHQPPEGVPGVQLSSSLPQPSHLQALTYKEGDRLAKSKASGPRGRTRCLDVLNSTEKIHISVNEGGKPVGPEVPKLTSFLGMIARDGLKAPLNYLRWSEVPDEKKEKMWEDVWSKFDIHPDSKNWVLKTIGQKRKSWKADLKAKHYIPHETDEERIAECDEKVLPDHWQFLVSYWNTQEAKEQSAKNKAIRLHKKKSHAIGHKSSAQLQKDERLKRPNGKQPSRAKRCKETSRKKNGSPMNATPSAAIPKLRKKVQQEEARKGCQERQGRVRTLGPGPSPDFGGSSHAEAMKMGSTALAEVNKMKKKMVSVQQKCARMETQMAAMRSTISYLHKTLSGQDGVPSEPSQVGYVSNQSGDLPSATTQKFPPKKNPTSRSKAQRKSTSKGSQRKG